MGQTGEELIKGMFRGTYLTVGLWVEARHGTEVESCGLHALSHQVELICQTLEVWGF